MREIKFRAYAKQRDKHGQLKLRVFKVVDIDLEEERIIAVGKGGGRYEIFFSQLEGLVQYTGLKDRNGKEIYDRDLWLPIGCETPRVVKWHKNGYWLHHPKTDMPLRLLEWSEDGEVIGNVYEGENHVAGA